MTTRAFQKIYTKIDNITKATVTLRATGVGNDEANQLFMFTQWSEMMTEFARTGKTSTVVLPSDFSQSASMFEQMLTAGKVQNGSKE